MVEKACERWGATSSCNYMEIIAKYGNYLRSVCWGEQAFAPSATYMLADMVHT